MNVYFQFFTQNQAMNALDLLRVVDLLAPANCGRGFATVAGKDLVKIKFLDIEALLTSLSQHRFNQVEVACMAPRLTLGKMRVAVRDVRGVLTASPSCSFWSHSKEFVVHDRPSMLRKVNAAQKESRLSYFGVKRQPIAFEIAFKIETSCTKKSILNNCIEWLLNSISEELSEVQPFGCCDIGGKELHVRLGASVLKLDKMRLMASLQPTEYFEMGKKFFGVHPIIFGSKKLSAWLFDQYGNRVKTSISQLLGDFAVVQLN